MSMGKSALTLLLLSVLLGVIEVSGYAYKFCDATCRPLTIANSYMAGTIPSNSKFIVVNRGGTAITSGGQYTPGETLSITPSAPTGYCIEVTAGTLSGSTSCSNTRMCYASGNAASTWTLPQTGNVQVNMAWTDGNQQSQVKIATSFTLTAPPAPPTPPPTQQPSVAPGQTAPPSHLPTAVPTFAPTFAPSEQTTSYAISFGMTLQGVSSADVAASQSAIVQVIASQLSVLNSQVAILSVSRRRLDKEAETEALAAATEARRDHSSLRLGLRKLHQLGQDALEALTQRRLAGTASVRFQVSGYSSQSAASAAVTSTSSWLTDTSGSGFAQTVQIAAPSLTISSTIVTSSTAQDNSLASSTASYQFSCSLSSRDTLYWTVSADQSYVTAFLLHKGGDSTKLDWVAMGLVDSGSTKMVNAAVPNKVYLYRPNIVASEYFYQIDDYSSSGIVSAANAARTTTHQGVTAVQSIDDYVTMQVEFNKASGVSGDVQLSLGQGNNNKLIYASGAVWPNIHEYAGFTTVSWADGVCKEVPKDTGYTNAIIWAVAGAVFLFNAKFSPFRNFLNDKVHALSSLKRLHPKILSGYIGNSAASWLMLDDNNAQTFTVPAVIALLGYLALNVIVYVKNVSAGLQFASGRVAVLNMWIALIPTSKNSTVLYFTGVPFERFVKFHRLVTKIGFFMMCVHLYYSRLQIISVTNSSNVFTWDSFGAFNVVPGHGAVAFICYVLMIAGSLKIIRDTKYEIFLVVHYMWIVAIAFNILHFKAGSVNQLGFIPGIVLQLVDKFYLVFAATRQAKLRGIAQSEGQVAKWEVDVVSLKVVMKENWSSLNYFGGWKWVAKLLSSYDPRPYILIDEEYDSFHGGIGQYYLVNVPSVSMLEWHPFSVSDIIENANPADASGEIGFHIKAMGPGTFTAALAAKAQNGPVHIDVRLRGPYGSLSINIFLYNHLVLIAGGIGITPMLPILDRIRYWCSDNKNNKVSHLRAVTIIWVARQDNKSLFQYMADRISAPAVRYAAESNSPISSTKNVVAPVSAKKNIFTDDSSTTQVKWNVKFFLTGKRGLKDANAFDSFQGKTHKYISSRPDVRAIVADAKGTSSDRCAVGALMCGPALMTADAATACADLGVDYHLETFGW